MLLLPLLPLLLFPLLLLASLLLPLLPQEAFPLAPLNGGSYELCGGSSSADFTAPSAAWSAGAVAKTVGPNQLTQQRFHLFSFVCLRCDFAMETLASAAAAAAAAAVCSLLLAKLQNGTDAAACYVGKRATE